MKTCLVTGLNSLIGWHVFLEARRRFRTFGTYAKALAAFEGEVFFGTDLDDPHQAGALLERLNPDVIIHARGICDLDLCEMEPDMAWRINVEATAHLLAAARRLSRLEKFVYISTDHVFSGEAAPYDESAVPCPKHVYGRTKAEAEERVRNSALPFLIIRPGLVIGRSVQGNKGPRDFLLSRVRAGKPTHLFTDEWRTPVTAGRLAETVMDWVESPQEGIVHVAGHRRVNRYELGRNLARSAGLDPVHVHSRRRAEDKWSRIRPKDLSLISMRMDAETRHRLWREPAAV